jgi:C4-dicarboxylate transporter DctM subunit
MSKGTPLAQTFAGVTPFLVSDFLRTVILVVFPSISLFLVRWLY